MLWYFRILTSYYTLAVLASAATCITELAINFLDACFLLIQIICRFKLILTVVVLNCCGFSSYYSSDCVRLDFFKHEVNGGGGSSVRAPHFWCYEPVAAAVFQCCTINTTGFLCINDAHFINYSSLCRCQILKSGEYQPWLSILGLKTQIRPSTHTGIRLSKLSN